MSIMPPTADQIAFAVRALQIGGKLDHVEITDAAGLVSRSDSSGATHKRFIRALLSRGLIKFDGYKRHKYASGRIVSREAYRLIETKPLAPVADDVDGASLSAMRAAMGREEAASRALPPWPPFKSDD